MTARGTPVHTPVVDALLSLDRLRGSTNRPYGESTLRWIARSFESLQTEWPLLKNLIVDGHRMTLGQAILATSPAWNGTDVPSRTDVAGAILFGIR